MEREEAKDRRGKTEMMVEESEVGGNIKTKDKIDKRITHAVGRDKGNLALSESDLNMTKCVAALPCSPATSY